MLRPERGASGRDGPFPTDLGPALCLGAFAQQGQGSETRGGGENQAAANRPPAAAGPGRFDAMPGAGLTSAMTGTRAA